MINNNSKIYKYYKLSLNYTKRDAIYLECTPHMKYHMFAI